MSDSTAWPSATKCKHMRRLAGCPDCGARWDLDGLDRLRAENERLREALGPFAKLGDALDSSVHPYYDTDHWEVEVRHLTNAYKALVPNPPKETEG